MGRGLEAALLTGVGRMWRRNMPSSAAPNMHANRIEAIAQSFTLDLSSRDREFVTLRWRPSARQINPESADRSLQV